MKFAPRFPFLLAAVVSAALATTSSLRAAEQDPSTIPLPVPPSAPPTLPPTATDVPVTNDDVQNEEGHEEDEWCAE